MKVNTRYDEAKQRYEAYSLEEVVKLLEANDQGDSLLERELFLLRRENQVLRQQIQDTQEAGAKAVEEMRSTLLKAYLECKRDTLTSWYADYCRKQEEGKQELKELEARQQHLKQQFQAGEISRMFYHNQNAPLKKRFFEVEQKLKHMADEELSELLPGVFNPQDDTGFITFNEVVEFLG